MKWAIAIISVLAFEGTATATPIEYDCDTANAHYSEISLNQRGPNYHVSGTITPQLLRSSGFYSATATVYIQSADQRRTTGVQVMREQGNRLTVNVFRVTNGLRTNTSIGTIEPGHTVPFELQSSSTGSFALVAGRRVDLGAPVGEGAKISVTCSTGQFHFGGLDWSAG